MLTADLSPSFPFGTFIKAVHRGAQTADTVKWCFKAGHSLRSVCASFVHSTFCQCRYMHEGLEEHKEAGANQAKGKC